MLEALFTTYCAVNEDNQLPVCASAEISFPDKNWNICSEQKRLPGCFAATYRESITFCNYFPQSVGDKLHFVVASRKTSTTNCNLQLLPATQRERTTDSSFMPHTDKSHLPLAEGSRKGKRCRRKWRLLASPCREQIAKRDSLPHCIANKRPIAIAPCAEPTIFANTWIPPSFLLLLRGTAGKYPGRINRICSHFKEDCLWN